MPLVAACLPATAPQATGRWFEHLLDQRFAHMFVRPMLWQPSVNLARCKDAQPGAPFRGSSVRCFSSFVESIAGGLWKICCASCHLAGLAHCSAEGLTRNPMIATQRKALQLKLRVPGDPQGFSKDGVCSHRAKTAIWVNPLMAPFAGIWSFQRWASYLGPVAQPESSISI